jgi:hypothetical protein
VWFVQVRPIGTVVALSEKDGQPYSRLTFSRHPKWLYAKAPFILLGFLIYSQTIQENIGILSELHYNRVLKFFKHSWATPPSDANTYGRTVNHRNVMKMLAVWMVRRPYHICGFDFSFPAVNTAETAAVQTPKSGATLPKWTTVIAEFRDVACKRK